MHCPLDVVDVRQPTRSPPLRRRGSVAMICGCMFSGKTTELLRRITGHPSSCVLAVKHRADTRYSDTQIVSHAGVAYPAVVVSEAGEIPGALPAQTEMVAIDEAHFFDAHLADTVTRLAQRGLDVVLAGLDRDSWGRRFPVVRSLFLDADEPVLRHATCARCGRRANRTQRLTPIVNGYLVGGGEDFEPRCRMCWVPPPEKRS